MQEFESAAVAALLTAPEASSQCLCTELVQNWRLRLGPLLQLGASACTDLLLQCVKAGAPIEFVLSMVRVRPGLELIEHEVVCPRVLRVALRVNGLLLQLFDAHAPTEEDTQDAHDSFATALGSAVSSVCGRGRTLIGVDLNARLLGIESTFVGPLAASSCKHLAIHRRPLIDDLAARGFKAVNTYLGPQDGVTWKHPTGQLYQIDF
eukprot:3787983-Amphidinium_carterae.1